MTQRKIRFHAFASVKGGVGKSTLAVALAKHAAASGGVPLLLDCDLLGTSLADGMSLCAPARVLLPDGTAEAPSGGAKEVHSLEETRRLRVARRDAREKGRACPVYLNDLLDLEAPTRIMDWAWRHTRDDGVRYFPSSSVYDDVVNSWAWLYKEPFDWVCNLAWILDDMLDEQPTLTDIVFDLPPGIVGFSHEALVMLSCISTGKPLPEGYPPWPRPDIHMIASPFIVMSSDRNDLVPGLELWGRYLERLPSLCPLVNRVDDGREAALRAVRDIVGTGLAADAIVNAVRVVSRTEALSGIFREGDMPIADASLSAKQILNLEVGR